MPLSLMNQKLRVFVKKNKKESVQYNAELSITEVIEVLPEKRRINNKTMEIKLLIDKLISSGLFPHGYDKT